MEFFKNSKSEFLRTHSKTNILIINTLNMRKVYRKVSSRIHIGSKWVKVKSGHFEKEMSFSAIV